MRGPATVALLLALAGCAGNSRSRAHESARGPEPSSAIPVNWPAPPEEIERRLAGEPFELRKIAGTGASTTGALKLELFFPQHNDTIAFKWKPVPRGDADGLQQFAAQGDCGIPDPGLVPRPARLCGADRGPALPPSEMLRSEGGRPPGRTWPGASCVLGVLSVWLDKVAVPERVLEPEQFASDAQYAANMGRFNLLTYLVKHEDGRAGNILVSKTPEDRRVFAIDNGIAFNATVKNWFVPNWNVLRIPAVPHLEIERLRRIDGETSTSSAW